MPKQILLADDSITIHKVIALTFAGEDYKITSVDNGGDAVIKAKEIRPDIILCDVMMPQKNGYEVCEAVKSDPELKTIPVLLLAGTFEPFDEELARKAAADGFIIKPFESQALIQKVRDLIGARPAAPVGVVPRPVVPSVPPAAPVSPKPSVPPIIPQPTIQPAAPSPVRPAAPTPPVVTAPPKPAPVSPTPPPPVPVPPKPVAAPVPQGEEDFWGTMMEEVEEKEAPKETIPVPAPSAIAPAEEVWEMGEAEEALPGAAKEEEMWESFAFEEAGGEEVMEAEEVAPAEEEMGFATEASLEELSSAEEVPEEEFIFETEEVTEAEEVSEAEIEEAPGFEFEEVPLESAEEHPEIGTEEAVEGPEEFAFGEEVPEAAEITGVQIEPQPEILAGYEQTFEPEAISREVEVTAPPSGPLPSPQPAQVSMTEEQLRAALSQVSREVIEKIVWEVVPDLAEMLIKEEIKRLQKKQ